MDKAIEQLVDHTNSKIATLPADSRLLISVSGIPGSGKTTLAGKVARGINSISKFGAIAAMIPMDGYHFPRAVLDAMPDPIEAHARRGAPFTFDAVALKKLVEALKEPITADSAPVVYAPSFDHAIKDPVEDDIAILKTQRVLIFEGNYLSLSTGVWGDTSKLFDELWFVEVERDVARQRLIARHLAAGLTDTREAAAKRADENDLPNGDFIIQNKMKPDWVIKSIEDKKYANTQ